MFEIAELGQSLPKADYQAEVPRLRTELLKAQRAVESSDFAVVIVVAGNDDANKAEVLKLLSEWFDARTLVIRAFDAPTEEELQRPEFWRYWMALPPKGRIGLAMDGWITSAIERRVEQHLDDAELDFGLRRAALFERELADDATLLIKLWLHVGKRDQARRLEKLESSKGTRWRVSKQDWKRHRQYDARRRTAERALRETSTADAPWFVIESGDSRFRDVSVGRQVLESLEAHLESRGPASERTPPDPNVADPVTILDRVDLTQALDKDEYETRLEALQGRLARLSSKVEKKRRGVIVVFEGWDAAGKGGAIRRVTHALDARQYQIIPVAKPTDEESAHHYLWRFWRHLPRLGRFTIYDRSWYGRVLVERVEAFCSDRQWRRAYGEINDFEEQLVDHGIVIAKFWLHISREEQLARFEQRTQEPWKQHKLGREDFRNREKWNLYEGAANEMIGRTSTEYAPWSLIAAEDKRWARVAVLEGLIGRIESAL
jgi:polyphosphate:AMP phosphotransferase